MTKTRIILIALEAAKDAGDDYLVAACRRLLVAARLGWKRYADERDWQIVQEFADFA